MHPSPPHFILGAGDGRAAEEIKQRCLILDCGPKLACIVTTRGGQPLIYSTSTTNPRMLRWYFHVNQKRTCR